MSFFFIIVYCRPHYTPLLYSKTGVYRGIHNFLSFFFFALKHRVWVLVRTVLTCTHSQCFEQNRRKSITIFHLKNIIFTAVKNHNVLHRHVFVIFHSFSVNFLNVYAYFQPDRVKNRRRLNDRLHKNHFTCSLIFQRRCQQLCGAPVQATLWFEPPSLNIVA